MKAYGHSRRDKLECRWGCCTGKSGKHHAYRTISDRNHRKTARQAGITASKSGVSEFSLVTD